MLCYLEFLGKKNSTDVFLHIFDKVTLSLATKSHLGIKMIESPPTIKETKIQHLRFGQLGFVR